jgi:dTMP kinase
MSATVAGRQLILEPGAVVVFEGLDRAGKSTQLELLHHRVAPGSATFAHMPSGTATFTQELYLLLENHPPASGLARQLAHLACHSETMTSLVDGAASGALVLDRWWWSTIAYGWYGGAVQASGISESTFRELISVVWAPFTASIVFLFLTPRGEDPNNVSGVEDGYRELAATHPGLAVVVPDLAKGGTHDYLVDNLISAGLACLA